MVPQSERVNPELLNEMCQKFVKLHIDLFAFRSRSRSSICILADMKWQLILPVSPFLHYNISHIFAKMSCDRTRAVIVVTDWLIYHWHPQLLCIAMEQFLYFRSSKNNVRLYIVCKKH